MSQPTKQTHFCEACQVKHTIEDGGWDFWKSKQVEGKAVYWCSKGIDCAGCKSVHTRTGTTKALTDQKTGKTYWICNKWFKTTGNGQIVWDQWSPQEVMSGVHYGLEREKRFGRDTEDHSIVQGQQVSALEQALDEIEELR